MCKTSSSVSQILRGSTLYIKLIHCQHYQVNGHQVLLESLQINNRMVTSSHCLPLSLRFAGNAPCHIYLAKQVCYINKCLQLSSYTVKVNESASQPTCIKSDDTLVMVSRNIDMKMRANFRAEFLNRYANFFDEMFNKWEHISQYYEPVTSPKDVRVTDYPYISALASSIRNAVIRSFTHLFCTTHWYYICTRPILVLDHDFGACCYSRVLKRGYVT